MFNKAPKNNKQKMFKFNLYWMYGLIFIMLFALYLTNDSSASKELGWTEFQKLAQENVFDRMVVYNKKNLVEATVKDGRKGLVFRKDSATLGTNPKVYVKIPSADKFSDFYDKSVAENHITTQVSFEEGDDAIWNFSCFVRSDPADYRRMDLSDATHVRWCKRWSRRSIQCGKSKSTAFR